MLTPFGVELRKLRLDRGMRLLELAGLLGHSSSFVSAVETGRKSIPQDYVAQVTSAMKLTLPETYELQKAADKTKVDIRVDDLLADQRQLVAEFARRVDTLPPDFLAWLKKPMHKSIGGEKPFFRSRRGLLVAPLSRNILQSFSEQIRALFVDPQVYFFPIMEVLEFKLQRLFPDFYVESCSRSIMGDDEGRVVAGQNRIMLREDVFDGACLGNGRHRFTACHELAHFLLHREVRMARTREDHQPIFKDAEWQADEFAGRLLLSPRHVRSLVGAKNVASACGMSQDAARVMLSKYSKSPFGNGLVLLA